MGETTLIERSAVSQSQAPPHLSYLPSSFPISPHSPQRAAEKPRGLRWDVRPPPPGLLPHLWCVRAGLGWLLPASPTGRGSEMTLPFPWRAHGGRSTQNSVIQDWSATYPPELWILSPLVFLPTERKRTIWWHPWVTPTQRSWLLLETQSPAPLILWFAVKSGLMQPPLKAGNLSQWIV